MKLSRRVTESLWLLAPLATVLFSLCADTAEAQKGVSLGKRVTIEYTVTLSDKTEVETNVGKEPFTYTQGSDQILPALQAAVLGLQEGETKTITLKPEEAYGPVNPEAFLEVEKTLVPENLREPGKQLVGRDSSGRVRRFKVHEVKEKVIVLDFNHPLAGKTLIFAVKVVKIE